MNNYYALIYLTDSINTKLRGAMFQTSGSPHRNVWEGLFEHEDGVRTRLVYSTNPGETALFTDRYRAPRKRNAQTFFDPLEGQRLINAELSEEDRLIKLRFENNLHLLFQAFGNSPNLFLIKEGVIQESFRKPNVWAGRRAPEPRQTDRMVSPPSESDDPRKLLLHFDQKLPRHLISPIIRHTRLDEIEPGNERIDKAREIVETMTRAMLKRPVFRVLANGTLCLLPDELLPEENQAVFNTADEAIRYAYYNTSRLRRFSTKMEKHRNEIDQALKRCERALEQLESTGKTIARADRYEQFGHLLMATAHNTPKPGSSSIELNNFYDENRPVSIEIRPELSIAENARAYYNRAAKARRRAEQSHRRRKELGEELQELVRLKESLLEQSDLPSLQDWEKDHQESLRQFRLLSGSGNESSAPWKTVQYRGYEIRIGKSAKSNDELTREAHKEDYWLHARGASGSHVVIRTGNKPGSPPPDVIHRAAGFAAWHSKLRDSKLVPVIVTKRKYVTKPKGAPRGSVRVMREDVIMATPSEPDPAHSEP